ncbi:hypothetical protein EHI8A_079840 [Entamoeba histolytica HM-1:IMSS-B]|uniref:Uncharacterized protein n=6 Tax=Entamoeba histolytica TaxID=5759 RepID=C4LUR3_ENTH1|nr:hypothetical protein EHI_178470 [Entamoeba histolytica HM-1:IMSS]EMD47722.1 Hypothetical protein EHI5A_120440 [Entamoeba histolytica KU27]EMH76404.1 hypothetical protein EHI8A_079840 [Entamoeba histolytica HM-1:IMSS-B]EMS17999.1 hypothetical protein KM1_142200 [Entamoeba histolytica HM-3:IMSS]ENY63031.1 hypothetical protein EHI7A_077550 [Entamoeba histolytica HM-1:IMSS-A]BAJ53819.1 cysteine protease binding protein family 6 [Entamoeba histolytica]|eukprot:XP_653036.1 hypothetical protein EHI_178470 [Entamoeba histolytica HM-1:IMSS]
MSMSCLTLLVFSLTLSFSLSASCNQGLHVINLPFTAYDKIDADVTDFLIEDNNGVQQLVKPVWYILNSTKDTTFTVSTCSAYTLVDTKIAAYHTCGETAATNFIEMNDDFPECSTNSKLQVFVSAGKPVYVAVYSAPGAYGRFRFTAQETNPTNTNCQKALEIKSFPAVVEGNTLAGDSTKLDCTIYSSVRGLWYTFVGDGRAIVADTCGSNLPFDVFLAVVKAPIEGNCDNMPCYTSADGGCPGNVGDVPARVYFPTIKDQRYYIFVTSYYQEAGTFQLTIKSLAQAIPTVCEQALSITSLPFSRSAPVNDSWTKTNNICSDTTLSFPAAYFTFKGTGTGVSIQTCPSKSGETKIEVFDSCSQSTCIQESDVVCGNHAYLDFMPESGREYYIRVACINGPCDLTFYMEYTSTSKHDRCESALLVTSSLTETAFLSELSESPHGCSGTPENGKGKWYKFIGTDALPNKKGYHLFSYDEEGNSPNAIEVHSGCGNYYCSYNRREEVLIDIKQTAFVFAFGGTSQALAVHIVIEETIEHENCQNARSIMVPYTILDWNLNAEPSNGFCSRTQKTEAVWYTFSVEKTTQVSISTCSQSVQYDSYLAVGSGSCGQLVCIADVNDTRGCNGGGYVTIKAQPGNNYYVFVGAESQGTSGQFVLSLYTNDRPIYSQCSEAMVLPVSKKFYRMTTYTQYSYATYMTFPDGTHKNVRGSYYLIPEGYKGSVYFMTCATGTEIPTFISAHDSCRGNDKTNYSFPSPPSVSEYSDFKSGNCGKFGTILKVEVNGVDPKLVLVSGFNENEIGFIDVEILMKLEKIPSSDSSSSSSPSASSTQPSTSSSAPNPSGESSNNTEDNNGTKIGWIIFGVVLFLIFITIFAFIIGFIIYRKKRSNNGYHDLS